MRFLPTDLEACRHYSCKIEYETVNLAEKFFTKQQEWCHQNIFLHCSATVVWVD